jgi:clan AA aspartic protease (TIGR02281 family)
MPDFACHRLLRALIAVHAKLQTVGMIVLLVGVTYGHQHSSVAAQLSDDNRLIGQFDRDYGCYINVMVDGVPFRMLVDTGSDDLAFNRNHLRKLGLNAKRLSYSVSIGTSNGIVRSALIMVHELRIGSFVLHDVQAVVDDAGADEPLLGMSVIKYMHLEIGRDGCELRW